MLKFKDFILIESAKDDSSLMPFKLTAALKDRLEKILIDNDDPIASALLEMDKNGTPSNITLIDLGNDNDKLSFADSFKVKTSIGLSRNSDIRSYMNVVDPGNSVWKKYRNEIRIGRLVKKIFPDKFKDSSVEKFVNLLKSVADDSLRFELYKGEQIRSGYKSTNYYYADNGSNPLMNSCMNDCLDYLDIYVKNASLLVLLNEDNHILGRAIVWKTDQGFNFMDRVYYVHDSFYYRFVKWAKDNKCGYKLNNNSFSNSYVLNGIEREGELSITLHSDIEYYRDYPYMDTFMYAKYNHLYTKPPKSGGYYTLRETDGGYESNSNGQDVHGNEIDNLSDYVFSDEQDGYILKDDAILISYESTYFGYSYQGWVEKDYLKDNKLFVYSDLDECWYKLKHCVWSDYHNQYLWRENACFILKDWVHYRYMTEYKRDINN